MIAFAGNSLLCRLALKHTGIDAASFTLTRILSGAIALCLIIVLRQRSSVRAGNWLSALALFIYAIGFSLAYISLPTGTGALLLFGAVQATMILWGFHKGERLDAIQWIGLFLALSGVIVLVFPGLSAPPLISSLLMLGAGIAWGIYSLRGKKESNPAEATAGNFLRAVPFAIATSILLSHSAHFDFAGTSYAIISGAITSGLGYVIWYTALPGLKATSAAAVQLSVPVLAATGGILLLAEPITLRYAIASVVVLGGIMMVIIEKQRQKPIPTAKS